MNEAAQAKTRGWVRRFLALPLYLFSANPAFMPQTLGDEAGASCLPGLFVNRMAGAAE